MTKYNEFKLPTKEEIEKLRDVDFMSMSSQAYSFGELRRDLSEPKNRFLTCLQCEAHKNIIEEAQEIYKQFKKEFRKHLDEVGKKGTADYDVSIEKPYNEKMENIVKFMYNNPKQKLVDLSISPVVNIEKGDIFVEIGFSKDLENEKADYPAEKFVVGLLFYHDNKFNFICRDCWNALVTFPEVREKLENEKMHFSDSTIPCDKSIFKILPLIIEAIKK